jgi:hypothetical protein
VWAGGRYMPPEAASRDSDTYIPSAWDVFSMAMVGGLCDPGCSVLVGP